jgi:hypothetical protein
MRKCDLQGAELHPDEVTYTMADDHEASAREDFGATGRFDP